MITSGLGYCFEEMPEGFNFRTVGRTITETDLVNFINTTGMLEVLFTDTTYAAQHAPGKGRIVPAALVFSLAEGLIIQSTLQGTGMAFLGMEIDVKGPTFVGDTIHVEVEVLESRPTSRNPDRGLVKTRNKIINQNGNIVILYTPLRLQISRRHRDAHWPPDNLNPGLQ